MKKLILFALLLMAFTNSKATVVTNNSGCDVDVWVVCYDYTVPGCTLPCCISSETQYTIKAGDQLNVTDCVPGCTTFMVRFHAGSCTGAGPGTTVANSICPGCWVYPANCYIISSTTATRLRLHASYR
jgi:hypothetical protein